MAGDWTSKDQVSSVRAELALAWGDKMAAIVNRTTDESWNDALLPMIDVKRFVRRGNERTELAWPDYLKLLEQWGAHSKFYEKHLRRATEAGNVVYLDLDERAVAKDDSVSTLRSISIYEFDDANRIVAVDICMGFHQPQ